MTNPVGGRQTDCPRCGGCGYIEYEVRLGGYTTYGTCPDCNPEEK